MVSFLMIETRVSSFSLRCTLSTVWEAMFIWFLMPCFSLFLVMGLLELCLRLYQSVNDWYQPVCLVKSIIVLFSSSQVIFGLLHQLLFKHIAWLLRWSFGDLRILWDLLLKRSSSSLRGRESWNGVMIASEMDVAPNPGSVPVGEPMF